MTIKPRTETKAPQQVRLRQLSRLFDLSRLPTNTLEEIELEAIYSSRFCRRARRINETGKPVPIKTKKEPRMTPDEALQIGKNTKGQWCSPVVAQTLAAEVERLRADLDWSLTHSCGFAEQGQPCGDCEYCHKVEERLRMRIEEPTQ